MNHLTADMARHTSV